MALSDPMPRTFFATLAALLALAAPASAASKTFTIRGAGFGHGVGMSQYGAFGYAQHGWTAAGILSHYLADRSGGHGAANRPCGLHAPH